MSVRTISSPSAGGPVREGRVLLAMCAGVLIAQVDTSVVNLAVQRIGTEFGAGVAALQWVLDAYNLVYAVLLLSGGLVADVYGRRRTFCAGAAVLALGSVACGLAPDIGTLIAARALTGLGAALLLPASLAIIRVTWTDAAARRRALGVWASCNGLAFVIGPGLGGVLIGRFGWRSVFFLAVPLAVAAFVLAMREVPETADRAGRRLDLPGQVLGAVALGALVFAAIMGREQVRACAGAIGLFAVALSLFLAVERRAGAAALVPLDLFARPAFGGAIAATASMTFGIYGTIFLLPLAWQAQGTLGPEGVGLALVPCALAFFLLSQRSGHLAARHGVRVMAAGGTAVIGCGLLVLGATPAGRVPLVAEAGLVLTGLGMGLNTGPLMSVAVESVSPARAGTASALINVARMAGATLGVAVLGAMFAAWGARDGLRIAMLTGGTVQLCGALAAWTTIRHHAQR
jgi:DHA2 family methylenomycin A resistance protein-like MFS transporter